MRQSVVTTKRKWRNKAVENRCSSGSHKPASVGSTPTPATIEKRRNTVKGDQVTCNPLSCDVFCYVDEGTGWTSTISRWGIGRYNHVSLYIGRTIYGPLLYESNGRGVCIVNLQYQTGRLVTVLRPHADDIGRALVTAKAIEIATDPQSYYDYLAYVNTCLPRVLKEKFPWLPIPTPYHRDPAMICSEAVAEAFWRAGIDALPQLPKDADYYTEVQLPGDFYESEFFDIVHEGRLFDDIKP
jgi:hypothetical protein